ncbi:type II toxin-antitoxin system RelE/ParE family toxin [Proteiniphilum sp. X52]|uniref:type II toxin-antitoxin system RelE/ParE family toxin n=1 Tax=Proteiniphilum sp. X52 TaxID=2382159 RepID=UPI001314198F
MNIAIKERTFLLKSSPFSGRKTDFNDIRILPIKHYSILYKIEGSRILIMAFWDNRQNPQKLLKLSSENK